MQDSGCTVADTVPDRIYSFYQRKENSSQEPLPESFLLKAVVFAWLCFPDMLLFFVAFQRAFICPSFCQYYCHYNLVRPEQPGPPKKGLDARCRCMRLMSWHLLCPGSLCLHFFYPENVVQAQGECARLKEC